MFFFVEQNIHKNRRFNRIYKLYKVCNLDVLIVQKEQN